MYLLERLHTTEVRAFNQQADESASFLMLNTTGEIFWLLVGTEEDQQTFAEFADNDGLLELSELWFCIKKSPAIRH